jgi:hypothetical protein
LRSKMRVVVLRLLPRPVRGDENKWLLI